MYIKAMSESLYVPMSLIGAGLIGWVAAGVVFVKVPDSTMPKDLLAAGTGAMALGGAAYQNTTKPTSATTRRKSTPRRQSKAKSDNDSTL